MVYNVKEREGMNYYQYDHKASQNVLISLKVDVYWAFLSVRIIDNQYKLIVALYFFETCDFTF